MSNGMNQKNSGPDEAALVSVIIPCFNHGEFLAEAVASVEASEEVSEEAGGRGDRIPYEIIIINDGSSDPFTCHVLEDFKSKGYHVIDQPNQGQAAARNTGIAAAKGRYILPLDSDNKIRPEMMRESVAVLNSHSQVGVVYGDICFFSEQGKVHTFPIQEGYGFKEPISESAWVWRLPDFDLNRLMISCYLDACAVFRKSAWQDCGGYDTQMPINGFEDWEMWLNIAKRGWEFQHVSQVFHDYRFVHDPSSKEWHVPEKRQLATQYIRKKHFTVFLKAQVQQKLAKILK